MTSWVRRSGGRTKHFPIFEGAKGDWHTFDPDCPRRLVSLSNREARSVAGAAYDAEIAELIGAS